MRNPDYYDRRDLARLMDISEATAGRVLAYAYGLSLDPMEVDGEKVVEKYDALKFALKHRPERIREERAHILPTYRALCRYKAEHDGCPPAYEELAEPAGLKSKSTVAVHLVLLELAGLIRRSGTNDRNIEIVGAEWRANGNAQH